MIREINEDKTLQKYSVLISLLIDSIIINNRGVVSREDLSQVAAMALISAVRSHDPSTGSLQSYIRKSIRNALIEQANKFSGVFTVDEKTKRCANMIKKLKNEGMSDQDIMSKLGIKTKTTYLSLVELSETASNIEDVEVADSYNMSIEDIQSLLEEEINLGDQEIMLVNLTMSGMSMGEIADSMGMSLAQAYKIKTSVKSKILEWGQK